MFDQSIVILFIAAAVALVVFTLVTTVFSKGINDRLRGRLTAQQPSDGAARPTGTKHAVGSMLNRISTAAAQPFMPSTREKSSALRRQLARAGIYSASAIKMVTGAKVICLVVGLLGGYIIGRLAGSLLLGLSIGGLVGYLGPSIWLKLKVKKNQRALTCGLPDALDLMVVCVEAGLTVDGAMQRVGTELVIAHPAISRELGIAHMETRVGLARTEALRNLGIRTGNTALQSLSAMLVQAERFGTSIAQALRVHADTLRVSRQLAAEEQASKASVKMSFPLVLFIFPATFIVIMGPTIINLMKSSLMQN